MNNDFKPSPSTTSTDTPKTYKVESTSPPEPPVKKEKKRNSKAFSFVSVLLLLSILGVGVLAYYWYDAKTQLESTQTQLRGAGQTNVNDNPISDAPGKGFVGQTAVAAQARNTVNAFMSTEGVKSTPFREDVAYIDDKFARVEVIFLDDKKQPTGKGEVFIFKKVMSDDGSEGEWAMVGINPVDAVDIDTIKTRYGVPGAVFTEDKPAS